MSNSSRRTRSSPRILLLLSQRSQHLTALTRFSKWHTKIQAELEKARVLNVEFESKNKKLAEDLAAAQSKIVALGSHYQLIELKEAEEKSLKESEQIEKVIIEAKELKEKIATITAGEYFEKHPESKKFDDEIRNDYWGY